jgi:hypothetical protein
VARHGEAGRGKARRRARLGGAGTGWAGRGLARRGKEVARRGRARPGMARQGKEMGAPGPGGREGKIRVDLRLDAPSGRQGSRCEPGVYSSPSSMKGTT